MDELRSKVPECARGLPILVVDHDTTSLMYLASMLEQYSYQVTTTEVTSVAVSMIRERKERFKLVMANINMDDINSVSFLGILIKMDIPIILMSSERSQNAAQKAIAHGACLHLEKPISLNDLQYLWQHVYRSDKYSMKKEVSFGKESGATKKNEAATDAKPTAARNDHFRGIDMSTTTNDLKGEKTRIEQILAIDGLNHGGSSSKTKRSYDNEEEQRNDKRKLHPTDSEERETATEEGGKEKKKNQSSWSRVRKSRLVWSQELHHKFTAAISALGDKNARPKLILKMMNEPNLTHRQVASHLQKYKAQVQRISTACTSNLSSVANISTSIYGKPGLFCIPQENKSVLSHLGHKSPNFSIGDTCQYLNFPQDSTAPISSLYQNQQFPNVPQNIHQKQHVTLDSTDLISSLNQTQELPSMLPYMHQKLDFIPESTVTASISLNQSQVFVSSTQTKKSIDFVAAEYSVMPNADKSETEIIGQNAEVDTTTYAVTSTILSENQKQHSPEFVDLLKVLNDEADECRGSGIEPHPGEVDQYCEWLKEAMLGNNEQP